MNKTILAVALSLVAVSAYSGENSPVTYSVQSSVSGGTTAFSSVTGVGSSTHNAFASSTNTTCVTGNIHLNGFSGFASTLAQTHGATFTVVSGHGAGESFAGASQGGLGTITASGSNHNGTNSVESDSLAFTNTFSTADVINSGHAASGSEGHAENLTVVMVGEHVNHCTGTVCATSTGLSNSVSSVQTFGVHTTGDETSVGGESVGQGNYYGNVTVTNISLHNDE